MQKLAEVCVRRPVFATVIVLALTVIGFFGYTKLGVDRFPKVDFPIVTILVREDGASPEEIETEVVDKVEGAVNTISGIDTLTSTSYEGVGTVIVTFQLEKNIDVAAQEVRDKVNGVLNDLPKDVDPPVVDKVDPDASPILDIALSAPPSVPIRDITEFADKKLRRQIESINGVGSVTLLGGRKRQINVTVDPAKLTAQSLTVLDVQRALETQSIQVPGGQVDQDTRKLTLRTHGRIESVEAFNDLVIRKLGNAITRLSDVATVEDSTEETATVAERDGAPTVLLSIRKQSGLNTVATVDAVKARLIDIAKTLPSGYKFEVIRDQSTFINASTNAVKEHLTVGSVLAAIVVLLFLWNIRTTIISAIAIPTSIISTFALMYAMGFTLNGLTLLALTLSVGIVIDDAIVVLENIYRFIEEKGMNPFEAAIEGTREIGLAVLATTLSLIAVFLPVAFMTGIVGRFMNSFGITMAFAIAISLIVSFTLTPMLSSRWIKPPKGRRESGETAGAEEVRATVGGGPLADHLNAPPEPMTGGPTATTTPGVAGSNAHTGSKATGFFGVIDTVYTALLRFSMRRRWVIVLACIATLFSTVPIGMAVNKNFLPDDDESQFQITVRAPEGTSLTQTQALGRRIAAEVKKQPGVAYTVLTIGNNDQQTENLATIFVKMPEVEQRKVPLSQQDLMQLIRTQVLPKFGNNKLLRTTVTPVAAIQGGGAPSGLQYFISGPDLKALSRYSETALAALRKVPGIADADSSLVTGKPELGAFILRDAAADRGVSVSDIANSLRLLVGGARVTDYYENGEQYEVHVRAALNERSNEKVIGQMRVPSVTASGSTVPLSDVVSFADGGSPSQISRLNRQRNVQLSANVLPGFSQQAAQTAMNKIVQDLHLPPGYTSGVTGNSREQAKAFGAFITAFGLSIIFMYLILAAQFESWVHPITILIALPLTLPFALLSILIFHTSLNIFSMLGVLVLFGVVKKNGILQVDHTNQLRARGMNRYDAIIQANRDRLRPILMTTVAFVVGMVPLVISNGTGAASNRAIGYTVIGGQTLSLLLTLLATPVFYSLFDDIVVGWGRVRGFAERIGGRLRFRR